MNCPEVIPLLDADLDGELDLVRHLEVTAHLKSCPECARVAETSRERRAALAGNLTRYSAPAQLTADIRRALPTPRAGRPAAGVRVWRMAGLAAALAACLVVGYGWGVRHSDALRLTDEAVTDHIRSLMAGHLTDVASTDEHTVKPWFAGKLPFSPPVADLADEGFPLIGGRLDTIANQPAAALVYRRRQHAINLFVWPAGQSPVGARHDHRLGFQLETWTRNDMNFVAVSEIPAAELTEFALKVQAVVR